MPTQRNRTLPKKIENHLNSFAGNAKIVVVQVTRNVNFVINNAEIVGSTDIPPKSRLCKANKKDNENHERYSQRTRANRAGLISSENATSNSSDENIRSLQHNNLKILTLKVNNENLVHVCKSASLKGGKQCKPVKSNTKHKMDFHTSVIQ